MKLPNNEIGISDVLAYRECPSRMEFQMRRWSEEGEPPEAQGPNTAYGSAVHHAIDKIARDLASIEEAIEDTFRLFGKWLDPSDLEVLREDLATYQARDSSLTNVRLICSEGEFRVPLMVHDGEVIYFRFKLDRLYQSLSDPSVFIHLDYKSSKWKKTRQEVHEDVQMWGYNWGIHEVFTECRDLRQIYDQLHFGQLPTRKSDAQRVQFKAWLIEQVKAILADEDLDPTFNQWCPWCPLLASCKEPLRTSEFAVARLAALAPEAQEGGKLDLDPDLIETYVAEFERAGTARKALERFEEEVKKVIRDLPQANRAYLGYELGSRSSDVWGPSAMAELHDLLGDEFYAVTRVTKGAVNEYFKGDDRKKQIQALASREGQNPAIKKLEES